MKRLSFVALGGAFVVVALLVAGVSQIAAADGDVTMGTWKQNVAKSKYDPGPAPKSSTWTYEPFEGDGLKFTAGNVAADGSRTTFSFSAHFDGKDYPIADSTKGADTVTLKRVDAYTVETTQKKAGKVVQTGRNVLSKDGKMLTATQKGTKPSGTGGKGVPYTNVRVFDKQ